MAHIRAADPEDHILGDVGGVVGDALQTPRNQQNVQIGTDLVRVALVICATRLTNASSFMRSTMESISSTACATSALAERKDSSARRTMVETAVVMRAISTGISTSGSWSKIQRTLRDIDRQVADALQVGVDLQHRQHESQIGCHGLLHGEQVDRHFIDGPLALVDHLSRSKTCCASLRIAFAIGVRRQLNGGFGHVRPSRAIVLSIRPTLAEIGFASSKPSRNVVFRTLVGRRGKYLLRLVVLDQLAHQKEAGMIGDARRLLHIMGHNDDGVLGLELKDQFLDLSGRNRIQGAAGSSISSNSGCTARARAMQSLCCCPPESDEPDFFFSTSFTSSHSAAMRSECSTISSNSRRLLYPLSLSPAATLS